MICNNLTFNQVVVGSTPARLTTIYNGFRRTLRLPLPRFCYAMTNISNISFYKKSCDIIINKTYLTFNYKEH